MLDPFPQKSRPIRNKFHTGFDGFPRSVTVRFTISFGALESLHH
jgi:hypothetical protein